ncbi:hypothetical protein BA896_021960 [Janthinobacterium lividum]|uniref:Uncharacterized protein n=1 Tax=Janthinobacterium lividum TaxID=29581 RepID=A0A1E8PKL5_9BURK|nr:hypothetical protein BA896_021960 [Janthinobacterium lividum]
MKNLFNFLVATVAWLGLFEVHLIKPLAVLPISAVMATLTAADFLLWSVCFMAMSALFDLFDRYLESRKRHLGR